jgi:hypothetical protein
MFTSVSLAWLSSTSEESLKGKSKKQEERRKTFTYKANRTS